jgi:hypothetical protein
MFSTSIRPQRAHQGSVNAGVLALQRSCRCAVLPATFA